MAHIPDQLLLEAFLEGDQTAFEQLVVRYRRGAVLFALHLTRDLAAAEDAVQEAMAWLWVHKHRIDPTYGFRPLLYTLVRRRCMDWFRYWRRLNPLPLEEADALDYQPEAVYQAQQQQALYTALGALAPADARLIHLLDIEGFSLKEAGAILGKRLGAIKTAHHRAKQRLKAQLEKEADRP